jgi:lactoylglutathione lyase
MRVAYAVVHVSNMARSISFYRDVLGLPVKFETPEWTEFATEGATLALHTAEGTAAAGHPGFAVPDLDAFHKRMMDQNIPCTQEPRQVFGSRIAQYRDPDGLTISVSQDTESR